jgi:hypothetical protein
VVLGRWGCDRRTADQSSAKATTVARTAETACRRRSNPSATAARAVAGGVLLLLLPSGAGLAALVVFGAVMLVYPFFELNAATLAAVTSLTGPGAARAPSELRSRWVSFPDMSVDLLGGVRVFFRYGGRSPCPGVVDLERTSISGPGSVEVTPLERCGHG